MIVKYHEKYAFLLVNPAFSTIERELLPVCWEKVFQKSLFQLFFSPNQHLWLQLPDV